MPGESWSAGSFSAIYTFGSRVEALPGDPHPVGIDRTPQRLSISAICSVRPPDVVWAMNTSPARAATSSLRRSADFLGDALGFLGERGEEE
ncbi:MAG: hypothetical protein ACT4QB_13250 [Gammaproteobacteria bacterium]